LTDEQFSEYYAQYFSTIRLFFLGKGFSAEEASDLAQDTFVQAHRKRDQFHGRFFVAWLRSIADSIWKNELRRRGTKKRAGMQAMLEENLATDDAPDQLYTMIEKEKLAKVGRIYERLPPRMRNCLYLRIVRGAKYDEIAGILGISIDTVKSQLSKARSRIRDETHKHQN